MISRQVCSRVQEIRTEFLAARPFPHVCIDSFFESEVAKTLLSEFPAFDKERSKNEFGQPGPKCVITDLKSISPAYSRLYDYISSTDFLATISTMTGIDKLVHDPYMYGGGTHENLPGAELDPHVDFNYDSRTGFHRRLNLLIYLNEEWSPGWGGAIELHSDPYGWWDGSDDVRSYNCEFNRCLIFETSEKSWHGFRRISLPTGKAHLSRKLISIYLYTETRPEQEIAPPHGTFYVPYPPIVHSGQVLAPQDVDDVRRLTRKRDALLSLSFETEKKLSHQCTLLERHVSELRQALHPTVLGYWRVLPGETVGYFADRWVAPRFRITLQPVKPVMSLVLRGWLPGTASTNLTLQVGEHRTSAQSCSGAFSVSLSFPGGKADKIFLSTECSAFEGGSSEDRRSLGFVLDCIEAVH